MITSIIIKFGLSLEAAVILLLAISLFVLSVIDLRKQEISNWFVIIHLCITLLHIMATGRLDLVNRLLGMLIISVPLYAIFIFNENIFGGGDIKLLFSVGGILGFSLSIVAFILAIIFAGIGAIILLLTKTVRRGDHMAFGNYISMGIFTSLILGETILTFYSHLFL